MKLLKSLLFVVAVVAGTSAVAQSVPTYNLIAGDNAYTSIPACGARARAKAVYSNATGVFSLRVCDNTLCRWPLRINVNAKWQDKQETSVFSSSNSAGVVRLNGECYEFPLEYRVQANQKNLRSVFGADNFFENAARIDIKL